MLRGILLVASILSLSIIASAGTQEGRIVNQSKNDSLLKEDSGKFVPLIGTYVGSWTLRNGTVEQVGLTLYPVTQLVPNANRSGVSEVPTINGIMQVCISAGNRCFEGANASSQSDKYPLGISTSADYDPVTGDLVLYFSGVGALNPYPVTMQFVGTFSQNEILGQMSTSIVGTAGTMRLEKVSSGR